MKKVFCSILVLLFIIAGGFSYNQTAQAASSLSAPKNLKASSITYNSFKLSWSSVKNAKSYDIYKLKGSAYIKIANTKSKSYTVKSLAGGTKYQFKIKAINGSIKSPFSKVITVLTKPSTPTGLSASTTSSSITLKWAKTTSATKYKVYIATSKTGTYKLKTTTTKLSYKVTGLTKNTGYYLKVSAVNASGEGSKSSYFYAKTVDPPPPAPKPIVYSGTGDFVIQNLNLTSQFYTAYFTHSGSSNFIVKDYFGDYWDLLVNERGNYSGTVLVENKGLHNINITADGNWTVKLLPVTSTSATSFSGIGDFVTPYFKMPGNKVWKFTHDGSSNFIIKAHTLDNWDLVINETGTYNGSQIVDLPSGENVFFEIIADGNWTISK